ncbi:thio(seleno)oxazole modification radical SAM maturase SbtM [Desulfopila sp. IMCC35008]|uniref:thio(seleno)oxazole modification radical SAM maturase SbtM n=1 Tax=Desulfopila sp. IMCC35008 TaxID=2653858 RepID=UPI0013D04259|nr:thio(seleno)oxazole modification radical SAM maturase SbtM [Desulfopila sp. IMCC35008]
MTKNVSEIYPVTLTFLPDDFIWPESVETGLLDGGEPLPVKSAPFINDLAAVEQAKYRIGLDHDELIGEVERLTVNPVLELIKVNWSGLPDLLGGSMVEPKQQEGIVLVYRKQGEEGLRIEQATGHDLLALKIVAEKRDRRAVAAEGETSVSQIDAILYEAKRKGLIFSPSSRITRISEVRREEQVDEPYNRAEVFTLQWHLTQKCDLHCKHCYDRSTREEMSLEQALSVLDRLYEFCEQNHVRGQVSFTGGNPILYPHFQEVYRQAVTRGFLTAILGNPVSGKCLDEIVSMQRPEYFQVSLEGLAAHNDYIRGEGHFDRVMAFLDRLEEVGVYRMVMLTLTRDNMGDVFRLTESLRDKVDLFNFNRLASVGEGAALKTVPFKEYQSFLVEYRQKAADNPIMGCKDNLFNILQERDNAPLTGGCTGFGCGAAFNFVSLLPDGEVHACRKFPSFIGNLFDKSLSAIYEGVQAGKYRTGSASCEGCRIRHCCGGCPAVNYGLGNDIFTTVDPYCFIGQPDN